MTFWPQGQCMPRSCHLVLIAQAVFPLQRGHRVSLFYDRHTTIQAVHDITYSNVCQLVSSRALTLLTLKGRLKMRDWNYRHHQKCRGGKCRTGNIGTMLQGVENAGLELSGPNCRGGKCGTKQLWKAKTFYTFWYKIRKSLLTQFEILW